MTKVNLTMEDIEKCQLVKSILEKEYPWHYTSSQLARRVGTNEKKLKVGFKIITRNTLYEFLTAVRIEKAKELLETTYLPIEVIAGRLGLDQSNLIKRFKKHTGSTPKDWRNSCRYINNGYKVQSSNASK